jgi:hypothetical protein
VFLWSVSGARMGKYFLHFMIPAELFRRVDEYRFAYRLPSRAATIIALLEIALGHQKA